MAKYVGKRIVPKHCGYWDKDQAYEMECIVYDQASGNSYISRKAVPAGTLLSQTDYWALCSDFNEQMYMLNQHVTESEATILASNAATEASVKADNLATKQRVDSSLATTQTSLSSRMDNIEARQDASASASTDADADYAAEVADARVDAKDTAYVTLGANIRGIHKALETNADYMALFTYENTLFTDGTLEVEADTTFGKNGSRYDSTAFDSIKIPCKKGERYCNTYDLTLAAYKGETYVGLLSPKKVDGVNYYTIDLDVDYFWYPLKKTRAQTEMCIRGWYYPDYYAAPGVVYSALENRDFLPVRGVFPSGDLNDISENCVYLLNSGTAYDNMPEGTHAGFLITLFASESTHTGMQLQFSFTTGIMRYRSKLGEWRDWVYLSLQKSEVKEMIEEAVSAFSVSNSALLKAHGIDDLLHTNLSLEDATTNGVTFKMNPDGSVTVTGTATGAGFTNIYASSTELPEWLERGKEYVFRINDPAGLVRFEVYEYNEDGEMIKPAAFSTSTYGTYAIPDAAYGLLIRFYVKSGYTVNTTVYPSISEKYTAEEYYKKSLEAMANDHAAAVKADQILSFHQYDLTACEKFENGYFSIGNSWVADENFDCYFVPITNDDRYYFIRSNTTFYLADKDKNILQKVSNVKKTCTGDGYDATTTYYSVDVPDVEDAAYVEIIIGKNTKGFLRSASIDSFLPVFPIGPEKNTGAAYEALFLGDTLITPDTGADLGEFTSNTFMKMDYGDMVTSEGAYSTGLRFFKKGTVLDVSCTNLTLHIRGFTAKGLVYKSTDKRYEFPADYVGTVDYSIGSWTWPDDDPNLPEDDEHFFIRVITPEDKKNNPWKGKVWYSYGTSISDIGIGDVIGNRGHSGKWPLYLDAVSGMERHNGAIGSGGIREGTDHGGNVKEALLTTPYDCDLVTLEVLPNDGYSDATMGEITDTDPTTECGAFRQCCEYITKQTRAKFVVLFVTSSTSDRNNSYVPYEPLASTHLNYRKAVAKLSQIAEYYGVPVIDAEKEAINWRHRQKGITLRDHIHPNYLGGEMFGRYIWGKLREMQPYPKFTVIEEETT